VTNKHDDINTCPFCWSDGGGGGDDGTSGPSGVISALPLYCDTLHLHN